jgi:ribonuclease inhibitor
MSRPLIVEVELANINSSLELHDLLMLKLNFPSWYGCNWDAFWDAITGLVEMPEKLILKDWSSFLAKYPRDATLMKECLENMVKKFPKQAAEVVYA